LSGNEKHEAASQHRRRVVIVADFLNGGFHCFYDVQRVVTCRRVLGEQLVQSGGECAVAKLFRTEYGAPGPTGYHEAETVTQLFGTIELGQKGPHALRHINWDFAAKVEDDADVHGGTAAGSTFDAFEPHLNDKTLIIGHAFSVRVKV
jgi:hypothetical protein